MALNPSYSSNREQLALKGLTEVLIDCVVFWNLYVRAHDGETLDILFESLFN